MATRTNAQIAAQVALESVINGPDGFSAETISAVVANAAENGVSDFYLDMARNLDNGRSAREVQADDDAYYLGGH
jgi:hypothetical protein